jgi:hypothetical protein
MFCAIKLTGSVIKNGGYRQQQHGNSNIVGASIARHWPVASVSDLSLYGLAAFLSARLN